MLTAVFASTSDPTIGPPDPWYSFAYRCNACESPTKATCNVVSHPPTYTCPPGKATTCADPASPKLHVCPRYMLGSAEFAAAEVTMSSDEDEDDEAGVLMRPPSADVAPPPA